MPAIPNSAITKWTLTNVNLTVNKVNSLFSSIIYANSRKPVISGIFGEELGEFARLAAASSKTKSEDLKDGAPPTQIFGTYYRGCFEETRVQLRKTFRCTNITKNIEKAKKNPGRCWKQKVYTGEGGGEFGARS